MTLGEPASMAWFAQGHGMVRTGNPPQEAQAGMSAPWIKVDPLGDSIQRTLKLKVRSLGPA